MVRLTEFKSAISHVMTLIDDENLAEDFNLDKTLAEDLVIYLYKAKLTQQPQYKKNHEYIRTILTLLPEENEIREFFICEFEIAKMLST